jgi:hypothetical protein
VANQAINAVEKESSVQKSQFKDKPVDIFHQLKTVNGLI